MSRGSLLILLMLYVAPAPFAAMASDASAAKGMDALLAKRHKKDSPGCAAGVYRGAVLLHAGGFGMSNLELLAPITPASAFDIGSTSKQFTATSALLLAKDGKLSLDDDIREHVPELPSYDVPITLRQLLNHTGGVRDYIDLLRMSGAHDDDVTTAKRALELLARQHATHFTAGARYEYSNSGYFLVALAIERVSGQSLREFAYRRIFEPLGMRHSLYRDDHAELVPNRAMAYTKDDKKGWRLDVSNWEQMGDGGILTTVEDLAKWNGNFYAPVVGDASLMHDLHERGTLNDGSHITYALGLMHGNYKGHPTVQHGGSWGGYISNLVRYPEQKLGIAVLCNSPDQPLNTLIEEIADLYLPALAPAAPLAVKRKEIMLPAQQLRRWEGTYRPQVSGDIATIRLNDRVLEVAYEGATYPLRPINDRTMQVGNVPVDVLLTLEPASAGQARRIRQNVNGVEEGMLIGFDAATPTPELVQAMTGIYHCPEVDADYRVEVAGAMLAVRTPRGEVVSLTPRERGYFVGNRMILHFPGGQANSPSAMELGTGRAQGLRCERR